jgi:cytochrome c oxidase assembly protein subunit 11
MGQPTQEQRAARAGLRCNRDGSFFLGNMETPNGLTGVGAQPTLMARNQQMGIRLALVALFFVGFGFALVPLYDAFCRITGFNGKTNSQPAVVSQNTQVDVNRWVKVEFLSHTMPGVGLSFTPEQFSMRVNPGAIVHTQYRVKNDSNQVFVGQAIPSVTPFAAAPHFEKIDCFCFTQQTFQPGEERWMPVVYVVKPDMDEDLSTVTLSYTFFEAPKAKL